MFCIDYLTESRYNLRLAAMLILPTEVWCDIFSQICQENIIDVGPYYLSAAPSVVVPALVLGSVCTHWYNIVTDPLSSSLFSTISVSVRCRKVDPLTLFAVASYILPSLLQRSGEKPLDISLDFRQFNPAIWECLSYEGHRWRSIRFSCPESEGLSTTGALYTPILRHINCNFPQDLLAAFSHIPQLETYAGYVPFNSWSSSSVKSLIYLGSNVIDFLSLMRQSPPSLRHCTIQEYFSFQPLFQNPVPLVSCRTLESLRVHIRSISDIFSNLNLPSLRSLALREDNSTRPYNWDEHIVANFVHRSGCRITHLSLENVTRISTSAVLACLPHVTHLSVYYKNQDQCLHESVLDASTSQTMVPDLRAIDLTIATSINFPISRVVSVLGPRKVRSLRVHLTQFELGIEDGKQLWDMRRQGIDVVVWDANGYVYVGE